MQSRCQRGAKSGPGEELRVESFNTRKSAVFVSPFVFSGHSFTAKKMRKKKVVESPMSQNKGFLWILQQKFFKGAYFGRKFPVRFDLPRSKALSLIGKLRKPARWRNEVKPIHPLL